MSGIGGNQVNFVHISIAQVLDPVGKGGIVLWTGVLTMEGTKRRGAWAVIMEIAHGKITQGNSQAKAYMNDYS